MSVVTKQKLERNLRWHAQHSQSDVFPTGLTRAELKQIGAQEFGGKLTYQIESEGRYRTFELVPRK